jgi:hypothetical protein
MFFTFRCTAPISIAVCLIPLILLRGGVRPGCEKVQRIPKDKLKPFKEVRFSDIPALPTLLSATARESAFPYQRVALNESVA